MLKSGKNIIAILAAFAVYVSLANFFPNIIFITLYSDYDISSESKLERSSARETIKKLCPCPTELEKMDCDDAVCNLDFILTAIFEHPLSARIYQDMGVNLRFKPIDTKPRPPPPKL